LRVIAHGIVGAESIIENESRGGEAEGIGWRNPGHQHKKGESQIGTVGKEGTEATSLYPSIQRELHVEKRIDTLPTNCVPTVCSRLLISSDVRMAARLHSAPRKTSHTLMHATFKIHDSQPYGNPHLSVSTTTAAGESNSMNTKDPTNTLLPLYAWPL